MAESDSKELWEKGQCTLFKSRLERRKEDAAKLAMAQRLREQTT